jgi:hypothetical protein
MWPCCRRSIAVAGRSLSSKPNPIYGQVLSICLTGLKQVMQCAPKWKQTELQCSFAAACAGNVPNTQPIYWVYIQASVMSQETFLQCPAISSNAQPFLTLHGFVASMRKPLQIYSESTSYPIRAICVSPLKVRQLIVVSWLNLSIIAT